MTAPANASVGLATVNFSKRNGLGAACEGQPTVQLGNVAGRGQSLGEVQEGGRSVNIDASVLAQAVSEVRLDG